MQAYRDLYLTETLVSLRVPCVHLKSEQADVAQLVEQPIRNRQVSGSSPLVGSSFFPG